MPGKSATFLTSSLLLAKKYPRKLAKAPGKGVYFVAIRILLFPEKMQVEIPAL
jgi:hypothetical protein